MVRVISCLFVDRFVLVAASTLHEIDLRARPSLVFAGRIESRDTVLIALLGHAHAIAGNPEEAMKRLHELKERMLRQYVPAFNFALIHIGLGEPDQAFDWLERAHAERSSWLVSLKVEPLFNSIRSDLRFADLVRRVGL